MVRPLQSGNKDRLSDASKMKLAIIMYYQVCRFSLNVGSIRHCEEYTTLWSNFNNQKANCELNDKNNKCIDDNIVIVIITVCQSVSPLKI